MLNLLKLCPMDCNINSYIFRWMVFIFGTMIAYGVWSTTKVLGCE